MTWRTRAAAAAALCSVVLFGSVFRFDAVRVRLAPDTEPNRTRLLRDLPVERIANRSLVVICVVRNTGAEPLSVSAVVGAQAASSAVIPAGQTSRLELTWDRTTVGDPPDVLQLSGSHAEWMLETAELANLFGFSRGAVNLVIVPRAQDVAPSPLWLWVYLALAAAIALRVTPAALSRWLTGVVVVLQSGVVLLFLASAMSAWVTAYRVGLAPRTYAVGVFLLAGPSVWTLLSRFHRLVSEGRHRTTAIAATGIVAGLLFFSAMWQVRGTHDGNYSGFLHLTKTIAARAPYLASSPDLRSSLVLYDDGYDAQFMYLMAFDPFLRQFQHAPERYREFIDLPPYRYGRIGFSVLTKVVSGDRPMLYPAVMIWLIVLAHAGIGAIGAAMASAHGRTPWMALAYVAMPAFMSSLVLALPESLAALAILGAIWSAHRGRLLTAAGLFAAASLFRETTLIIALAVIVGRATLERSVVRAVAAVLVAVGPLVCWRGYVALQLVAEFGWAAAFPNPAILGVPGVGLSTLFMAGVSGTQAAPEVLGALTFPILIVTGAMLAAAAFWLTRSAVALAGAIYGLLALSLNYAAGFMHLPSAERTTYELFLCLYVLLVGLPAHHLVLRRAVAGFFIAAAFYTFTCSPQADIARAALFLDALAP